MSILKHNGNFVLKIYDIFNKTTIQCVYLLCSLFKNIKIFKTKTSRTANSEKYIICYNLTYTDEQKLKLIEKFYKILKVYNNMQGTYFIDSFLNINIQHYFINKIQEINSILGNYQIKNILTTMKLIENNEKKNDKICSFKNENIQKCITWCIKNNIPYNTKYKPQINPREINLFHIANGKRLRIVDDNSQSNGDKVIFYTDDLINEINKFPERLSPNALMRPLYQEVILPNVAYVGGQAELAYWFQLKALFDFKNVLFPILCLRNSSVLIDKNSLIKAKKLGLENEDFFLKKEVLAEKKVFQNSKINLDLSFLKKQLIDQFSTLEKIASKTHPSFFRSRICSKEKTIKRN